MPKKSSNYLLAKTGVGQIKKGFHDLPLSHHTYGKLLDKDRQGARQVIWNWKSAIRSETRQGGRNYIEMNRQGIKQGIIDSKDLQRFYNDKEIKVKAKKGQKVHGAKILVDQLAHGILTRPSTPIKNVIQNRYATKDEVKDVPVNEIKNDKQKKSPTKSRSTHKGKYLQHQNKKKQIQLNNFKLSKFMNIPSKIKPLTQSNIVHQKFDGKPRKNDVNQLKQNKIQVQLSLIEK